MIKLSRNQIATLRNCDPSTVTRHDLPQTEGKRYDLSDPEVWEFVTAPTVDRKIREYKIMVMALDDENGNSNLDEQKLKQQVIKLEKQNRDLELAHEIKKQNLIPTQLIGIFLGYFASGISTNFLTIGNRIARGDTRLKDRIDKAISKAIKKTLETAGKELKKESEQIIKYMEGEG